MLSEPAAAGTCKAGFGEEGAVWSWKSAQGPVGVFNRLLMGARLEWNPTGLQEQLWRTEK